MPVNTELVARLLQPVDEAHPAGKDLRYDSRVDAVRESRREELYVPPQDGEKPAPRKVADWPAVIALTSALLTEETKDLQLAAWLTEALLQRDGFGGLATGLVTLRGLLEQFWDTVHPLPEDGDLELRIGPLEWVGERLVVPARMAPWGPGGMSFVRYLVSREVPTEAEAEDNEDKRRRREEAVSRGKPTPESVDAALDGMSKVGVRSLLADMDAAIAALTALEQTADGHFGRNAPAFNPLRSALDEIRTFLDALLARKLALDPDPADAVADAVPEHDGAGTVPNAADGAALTPDPASGADAAGRIAAAARWLRQQDPANPAAYLMLRGFRWGELRATAPDIDMRLLEAPATPSRVRLKTLRLDGKWAELLEGCETVMASAQGRGWLDLQRYALTALAELGPSYDAVASAVRSELRLLLTDLPSLPGLTLMDDTPTANEETRRWLETEGLLASPDAAPRAAAGLPGTHESDDGAGVLSMALADDATSAQQGGFAGYRSARRGAGRDVFEMACAELSQGRATRAVELLLAELARDRSARGRFVRQTQIAYVMVEAGLDAVAYPILQRLVEIITERELEGWEAGPLVAQPMALLCRVLDRTDGDQSQRAELYLRVCRLDPLQGIALHERAPRPVANG